MLTETREMTYIAVPRPFIRMDVLNVNRVATLVDSFYRPRKIQFFRGIIHSALPLPRTVPVRNYRRARMRYYVRQLVQRRPLVQAAGPPFVDVQMRHN